MNDLSWCLSHLLATMLLLSPLPNRIASAIPLDEAPRDANDSPPLYFPPHTGEWERVTPAEVGWDPAALKEALSFAGERKSSGVVVLYNGRILAEQYWRLPLVSGLLRRPTPYVLTLHGKSSSGHQIEDVASVQKSVVAVLAGIAQQKGLLKITDRVDQHLGAGWSKAPREAESQITLRHLLTMTSGLNTSLEFAAEAGTKWRYNTTAYAQSLKAVAAAADMQPNELTRKWLTGPIGMADSRWVTRPYVKTLRIDANALGFATTARDLARFGLLILAQGAWGEKAVVEDRKYLRAMLQPSQQLEPSYGFLWWVNANSRRVPGAPNDLVAAIGNMERIVYVVPSLGLVVVRLGDSPATAKQPPFMREMWKRLMAAAPKENTKGASEECLK